MATQLQNLDLEKAHFKNFIDKLPRSTDWCENTVNDLLSLGLIQVSTGFEHALAQTGGHAVVSLDTHDLDDGTDAKLASVRTSGYGKRYSAPVSSIFGKTGALRVQVYERKKQRFYYFLIPKYAYSHIPRTSNIEIPFEIDGTPRRTPKGQVKQNWWWYEVESFEEVSK